MTCTPRPGQVLLRKCAPYPSCAVVKVSHFGPFFRPFSHSPGRCAQLWSRAPRQIVQPGANEHRRGHWLRAPAAQTPSAPYLCARKRTFSHSRRQLACGRADFGFFSINTCSGLCRDFCAPVCWDICRRNMTNSATAGTGYRARRFTPFGHQQRLARQSSGEKKTRRGSETVMREENSGKDDVLKNLEPAAWGGEGSSWP